MRRRPDGRDGDLLGGTLDMLVLQTLRSGPAHGFAIALSIEQRSLDVLLVEEGSLYPALHRLEDKGWVTAEWGTTENNRRAKFYALTAAGRKQLVNESQRWSQLVQAVSRVMEPFDYAQGRPFGQAQGRPFGQGQGRPFGHAQGRPTR